MPSEASDSLSRPITGPSNPTDEATHIRVLFIERLAERAATTEEVLFDGRWMSPTEARRRYGWMKWRSRFRVLEILIVLFLLSITSTVPLMLLNVLGGIVK